MAFLKHIRRIFLLSLMTVLAGLAQAAETPCNSTLDIDLPEGCDSIEIARKFDGLENFRQLTTPDNGIRPDFLFRSDQLDELSAADIAALTELGIETVVDLRSHEELEEHPDKLLPTVSFMANLPIGSDPADVEKLMPLDVAAQIRPLWFDGQFEKIDALLKEHNVDLEQARIDRYRDFATDFDEQVSRFLHLLTDDANFPLVFHCAGGKDRTGYLAAVTLMTLGYSEEDVLRDYLTTNLYTYGELSKLVSHGPVSLQPAFGAHPEQILASLNVLKERYGSFDRYLEDRLGINKEEVSKIKANLLVK
ncbi:tyrosine-protein phosphatase [Roseibium sp. SCP14]|uniref:tyrosine-protein phosphatase n=1 Tax=Roseibium sp. SCP14 TaxID=3141375 RepID=UPI003337AC0A